MSFTFSLQSDHPFFFYDDWFIASTPIKKGIPSEAISQTKKFDYNNIDSLQNIVDEFPDQVACVVLEPVTNVKPQQGFLDKTYEKKEWLKKAANNVKNNSEIYNSQLKSCEKELNKKGLFGFL